MLPGKASICNAPISWSTTTCPGIPTAWNSASGASIASVRRRSAICGTWWRRRRVRGDVFARLLKKLEVERAALGGAVFDVLGKVFQGTELRRLLIDAIRYGDRPEVRARLTQQLDQALDTERLQALIAEHALAHDTMDTSRVLQIREAMERAEARRLQPHFIASFFLAAFRQLGGTIREREPRRYEITHVPAAVRSRDRLIGRREPVLPRYERITFQKELIS